MVSYFVKAGDVRADVLFNDYLWGARGLGAMLKPLTQKNYGEGLKLLLIMYYVEGQFEVFGPEYMKLLNYSTRNRDIAVKVAVRKVDFHYVSDARRREFVLNTTLEAIELVRARLEKRKLGIDFVALRRDVEMVGREFVAAAVADEYCGDTMRERLDRFYGNWRCSDTR
jgi:hypothetical protein